MRVNFKYLLNVAAAAVFLTGPAFAEQTNAPAADTTKIKVEEVAKDLVSPWSVQVLPDGRYLVTERPGRLNVIGTDGTVYEPVTGMPDFATRSQGGLLDVVLAPDFATSQEIFFSYSEPRGDDGNGTAVMRAKLVLDDKGSGALADAKVIFRQEPAVRSFAHFGSRLVFAPDGTLFVTLGERQAIKDQAQNPKNHLGKIVRITRDGAPAPDNPNREGWDPFLWSIGHRNPQGAVLEPGTGQLWITEHGAKGGDELNHPEPGKNYGWPVISYGRDYDGTKIGEGTAKDGLEPPFYYWDPSIGTSGLMFYTGDLFPAWKGNLLTGALKGMHIERLVLGSGGIVAHEKLLADFNERIRDLRQAPDGSILVLTDSGKGRLLRLVPG